MPPPAMLKNRIPVLYLSLKVASHGTSISVGKEPVAEYTRGIWSMPPLPMTSVPFSTERCSVFPRVLQRVVLRADPVNSSTKYGVTLYTSLPSSMTTPSPVFMPRALMLSTSVRAVMSVVPFTVMAGSVNQSPSAGLSTVRAGASSSARVTPIAKSTQSSTRIRAVGENFITCLLAR